ncbi:MAG: hypothetical protein Q4G42_03775 [Neisseria sp.]|nr:hypothetical protein [Neisseria sp.]
MQKLTIKHIAVFILLFGTLNLQGCRAMLPRCSIEEWWDGECSGYLDSYKEQLRKENEYYNSLTEQQKIMQHKNAEECYALAGSPEHRVDCKDTGKYYEECKKLHKNGYYWNTDYYHQCMKDRGTPLYEDRDKALYP